MKECDPLTLQLFERRGNCVHPLLPTAVERRDEHLLP
jgi:hypothetical protein